MAKLPIKKFKENYQKVIVIEKFDISPTPTRVTGVTRGDRTEGGEERREGGEEILADRPIKGSTRGPRGTKKHKSMSFTKKYDHCPDFRETIEVNIHERN